MKLRIEVVCILSAVRLDCYGHWIGCPWGCYSERLRRRKAGPYDLYCLLGQSVFRLSIVIITAISVRSAVVARICGCRSKGVSF